MSWTLVLVIFAYVLGVVLSVLVSTMIINRGRSVVYSAVSVIVTEWVVLPIPIWYFVFTRTWPSLAVVG